MFSTNHKKLDDTSVDIANKTVVNIRLKEKYLEDIYKNVKNLQKAWEALSTAQKALGSSLLELERLKNRYSDEDATSCFVSQGRYFTQMGETNYQHNQSLEDVRMGLREVIDEQEPFIKNFEKSWKETVNPLVKNRLTAETRSRRELKKQKNMDKSKPSKTMLSCVRAVEQLDEARRSKLKELLLLDRARSCTILERFSDFFLALDTREKSLLEALEPLYQQWENVIDSRQMLPPSGKKQCEVVQATYVPIEQFSTDTLMTSNNNFEEETWSTCPTEEFESGVSAETSYLFSVRALYDCEGQESDELTFRASEVIHIVEEADEQWYYGQREDGVRGYLPVNYVERIN
ncbi:protein kinase C and casein kinase substrate in neurons protein 3-like isoform X2 [Zophobas morio]|uniref:protein kinase C and casein kinase substrate in neurons protein 3-like isoform X2 n=1 Tax=Zophobas morio TaxID=2755281 RepID=UPI003082AF0E